jgi:catechol 2,3-dioxygenase-like lactoylglutathione lyase family enzyme
MIKHHNLDSEFELGGINHVALVCADMERTVDVYSDVLGMPLIKSLDVPNGMAWSIREAANDRQPLRAAADPARPADSGGD